MACRVDAARFVKHAAAGDVMPRQYAASNELVLGHVTDQMGNHAEAAVHYLRGSRLLPDDADLRELLRMTYFRLGSQATRRGGRVISTSPEFACPFYFAAATDPHSERRASDAPTPLRFERSGYKTTPSPAFPALAKSPTRGPIATGRRLPSLSILSRH